MMRITSRTTLVVAMLLLLSFASMAQPIEKPSKNKPYKILTSGKQVTVKSTKSIQHIMVWTASGHRIVEQRDINQSSYTFRITVPEKVFYLMIQYDNNKPFTEKIGIR